MTMRLAFPALAVLLLASACVTGTPAPKTAASPPPAAPAGPPPAPATPAAPQTPAVVLARVGDDTITVEQFRLQMAQRGGRIPGQFSTVEQRQALLDEMI